MSWNRNAMISSATSCSMAGLESRNEQSKGQERGLIRRWGQIIQFYLPRTNMRSDTKERAQSVR